MARTTVKQHLHAALLGVREKVNRPDFDDGDRGICSLVGNALDGGSYRSLPARRYMYKLMEEWPEGTGDTGYPVPATAADKRVRRYLPAWLIAGPVERAAAQFDWAADHYGMWNKRTKYGRSRRALLDYLIAETAP